MEDTIYTLCPNCNTLSRVRLFNGIEGGSKGYLRIGRCEICEVNLNIWLDIDDRLKSIKVLDAQKEME